jgi:hypothetical protein
MKLFRSLALPFFSLIILGTSCKKHSVPPVNQLSLLPPTTQNGAGTIGCLVNGTAFVPENASIIQGPNLQCNYIYTAGGYYFTILVSNKNNDVIKQLDIETDSVRLIQGQTILLENFAPPNANASYALISSNGNINRYETTANVLGRLTLTKLDTIKQIASGTFYFTGVNKAGDTIKVTDGRFDMSYTR